MATGLRLINIKFYYYRGYVLTEQQTMPMTGLQEWRGCSVEGITWEIHKGDVQFVLDSFDPNTYNCVITSPPYYWQRDYKVDGQIGLERTIDEYVDRIVESMERVRRVLAKDGLLFLNLGDTYYSAKGQPKGNDKKNGARRFGLRAVDASGLGVPRKTIIGIPWRVALAMITKGWVLRSPIVWKREANLPEPTAKDRPWRTYEMIFMFSKSPRYYFDRGRLDGDEDVWTISDRPVSAKGIHSAAFPDQLVQKCLDIGCPEGGRVLDPFAGSGTVLRVAVKSGRPATGIDLSERFCAHMVKELSTL
jgi:DNA modification methylase